MNFFRPAFASLPRSPGRRRFLAFAAGGAGLLAAGWSLARPALVNPCRAALPPALADSMWLQKAWQGIDPAQVWDMHVHLAGIGDGGSGIEIGPHLDSALHPLQYAQRLFYMNAGCARNAPGQVDQSYVERLKNLMDGLPAGAKLLLLAFDRFYDESGAARPERTAFFIPDAYARQVAESLPERLAWAASIHPYRADGLDALEQAAASGARAVKWLPAAMGMDPASPRCDGFFRALARLDLPLIVHCGKEKAVKGGDSQALGNPLRLRRALGHGVRVVVAHCASTGEDADLDRPGGPPLASFALFVRLMDTPAWQGRLFGDISAITQRNRPLAVLRTLLERRDWHGRLLNGSDYPLPGILPLVYLPGLARQGLLPREALPDLQAVREHNPILFDFALKRLLNWQGQGFGVAPFHSRGFFDKTARHLPPAALPEPRP